MRYIIDGMKLMLKAGTAKPDMDFSDVQDVCEEPDLHEFDDLAEMEWCWEEAKTEFRRELMPLKSHKRIGMVR